MSITALSQPFCIFYHFFSSSSFSHWHQHRQTTEVTPYFATETSNDVRDQRNKDTTTEQKSIEKTSLIKWGFGTSFASLKREEDQEVSHSTCLCCQLNFQRQETLSSRSCHCLFSVALKTCKVLYIHKKSVSARQVCKLVWNLQIECNRVWSQPWAVHFFFFTPFSVCKFRVMQEEGEILNAKQGLHRTDITRHIKWRPNSFENAKRTWKPLKNSLRMSSSFRKTRCQMSLQREQEREGSQRRGRISSWRGWCVSNVRVTHSWKCLQVFVTLCVAETFSENRKFSVKVSPRLYLTHESFPWCCIIALIMSWVMTASLTTTFVSFSSLFKEEETLLQRKECRANIFPSKVKELHIQTLGSLDSFNVDRNAFSSPVTVINYELSCVSFPDAAQHHLWIRKCVSKEAEFAFEIPWLFVCKQEQMRLWASLSLRETQRIKHSKGVTDTRVIIIPCVYVVSVDV